MRYLIFILLFLLGPFAFAATSTLKTGGGGTGNGLWTSWTPTFVGVGTVTNIKMKYRTVGSDSIEIEGTFTVGTPTATTVTMSLPASLAAKSDYDANNPIVGIAVHNVATTYFFSLIANASDTNLYFGSIANTTFAANGKQTGTNLFGAGEQIYIPTMTVRVQ